MTPKELLEACEMLDNRWAGNPSVPDAVRTVVAHVRATVRLDDDEPPTAEWCRAVGLPFGKDDRSARKGTIVVKFMDGLAKAATSVLFRGNFAKLNPSRRDVRDLCRIVGVELKEPDHAEP